MRASDLVTSLARIRVMEWDLLPPPISRHQFRIFDRKLGRDWAHPGVEHVRVARVGHRLGKSLGKSQLDRMRTLEQTNQTGCTIRGLRVCVSRKRLASDGKCCWKKRNHLEDHRPAAGLAGAPVCQCFN
jgi:hypothetical protein